MTPRGAKEDLQVFVEEGFVPVARMSYLVGARTQKILERFQSLCFVSRFETLVHNFSGLTDPCTALKVRHCEPERTAFEENCHRLEKMYSVCWAGDTLLVLLSTSATAFTTPILHAMAAIITLIMTLATTTATRYPPTAFNPGENTAPAYRAEPWSTSRQKDAHTATHIAGPK